MIVADVQTCKYRRDGSARLHKTALLTFNPFGNARQGVPLVTPETDAVQFTCTWDI